MKLSTDIMPHSMGLHGTAVYLHVLGCRSNIYEGEFLAGELEARGATVNKELLNCRAAVIVSCSVTAEADRKCRQLLRRARRAVGNSGVVAVCGCWAQGVTAEEARTIGVDILVGNRKKTELADVMASMLNGDRFFADLRHDISKSRDWEELTISRPLLHTRAFLKVQEGCDHFCSYCIIPFLRGRSTSRPETSTLDEAKRILGSGCKELVLTGIHLGMYGRDTGTSLAKLVKKLSALNGLARLRMGSLEPFALDDELLRALADSPVFCPHLHLPLQSGDDTVLMHMRRGYTSGDFLSLCRRVREILGEDVHISTDVMVGFPGEDEEAFINTMNVMRSAGFGRVHIFPYSPRSGTPAAKFDGRLEPSVLSERAKRAGTLGEELLSAYARQFTGTAANVLAEEQKEGYFAGYTPHFVQVSVSGNTERGKILRVALNSEKNGVLSGSQL